MGSVGKAEALFKALNGVFCIYKPPGVSMKSVIGTIRSKLADSLNSLDQTEPRIKLNINTENDDNLPSVTSSMDWADHPLVVGPRFLPEDFNVYSIDALSGYASGVTVMGIGTGSRFLSALRYAKLLRVYHMKGELGKAHTDFTTKGNLLQRSTHEHLTLSKINRVVASFQAGHQKHMFAAAGVDPLSQEAYELASEGLIRPKIDAAGPVLYSIKVIEFQPPEFILEIHCCNETSQYLLELVHKIGLQSRTNAVCTQLRRIRYGVFNLDLALLKKHWEPEFIADNILECRKVTDGLDFRHLPKLGNLKNRLALDSGSS